MRIAISGKAGSGKTALAKTFIEKYGFEHISFAKKVKQTAMVVYNLTEEEAFGKNKNRELLQRLGQGLRENIDYDIWVNAVVNDINKKSLNDNLVLDDLRYKNEFKAMKENGFLLIRILSPEETRRNRIPNTFPSDPSHISEVDLDDVPAEEWDVIINNVSDLNYLEHSAKKIMDSFIKVDDNV